MADSGPTLPGATLQGGVVEAAGVEPAWAEESAMSNLGPQGANRGPTGAQVGQPQQVSVGADVTTRTEPGLGESQPGRRGSTTGAQLPVAPELLRGIVKADPELHEVEVAWPRLPRVVKNVIVALVTEVTSTSSRYGEENHPTDVDDQPGRLPGVLRGPSSL